MTNKNKTEKPEIYTIKKSNSQTGISRRNFIKLGLVSGTAVALGNCSKPTAPQDPGIVTYAIFPSAGGEITIAETETIEFSIDAYSPDGNELTYIWNLDNFIVSENSQFILQAENYSLGYHILKLDVTDNYENDLSYAWNITISDHVSGLDCGHLYAHSSYTKSVTFSPDGTILASGSYDHTMKLWSIPDGTLISTLEEHSDRVNSVTFSPDGTMLASGSMDNSIKLWSIPDGTLISTLEGHSSGVKSVAFSPDGTMLATGSSDTTIKLWSIPNAVLISTLEGHSTYVNSVTFSPDGTMLASGSKNHNIKLWSMPHGTLIATLLAGNTWTVNSVTFSPDGTMLASGGQNNLKLWSMPTGIPNWCIYDPAVTEPSNCQEVQQHVQQYENNTCICDVICICNTILIPGGATLEGTITCVCDTISVGTGCSSCSSCSGCTSCAYWYPN